MTEFNFKIVYRPGTRGGKPDALSRRPEYRPEEGAAHSEQSILKPEHFQISIVRGEIEGRFDTGNTELEHRIRIKRLSNDAILPTKGSRMAAGHDLYALNDIPIPSKGQALVETGIAIGLPKGTYGRLASRSGLASKEGIEVGAGVIDADYTGEL